MSNPSFSTLNPYDAYSLYGESPTLGLALRDYLASLRDYTTDWDRGNVETKKKVYALMTGLQTLTISIHGYVSYDFYLRPSIKSITLNFNLSFCEDRRSMELGLLHNGGFLDWFQTLETYLRKHPESELEELHINFSPEVSLYLCIADYHIAEYDKDGPLYEDEDWVVKTDKFKPSSYLFCLDESSGRAMKKIGKKLLNLLTLKSWKAITLPYHFPSAAIVAEMYPFTTFTEKIDENPEDIYTYLYSLHREHREENPPFR